MAQGGGLQSGSGEEEQMGTVTSVPLGNDGISRKGGFKRCFRRRRDLLMGYAEG